MDCCAYKQHPFMCKSTLLLFTHKLHCLQTFEPISHHSLRLCGGSVYIHIGVLNKLDVGVLLLFTKLSFCKNMEVVLCGIWLVIYL